MWNTNYFKPSEFDSPDEPGSGMKMSTKLIDMLAIARKLAGIPFTINSGYRSKKHNVAVGGTSDSAHTKGLAVDIKTKNSVERYIILTALIDAGFTRIGIGRTYIHVDIDETKAQNVMWDYYPTIGNKNLNAKDI